MARGPRRSRRRRLCRIRARGARIAREPGVEGLPRRGELRRRDARGGPDRDGGGAGLHLCGVAGRRRAGGSRRGRGAAAARHARADDLQARFDAGLLAPGPGGVRARARPGKRPVDAITSNMGHCLWAGIVADPEKAAAVARGWCRRSCSPGGAFARSPPRWLASARSATTTARSGRTTRRSAWPDSAATGSSRRPTASRAASSPRPRRSTDACRSSSPASRSTRCRCRCAIRPRAPRRPGRRPRPCWWCGRCSGSSPTSRTDGSSSIPSLPEGATKLSVADLPLAGTRVTIEVDGTPSRSGLPPGSR